MANPHEELEHAEHMEHAAHDPFGARVALSIAVIAAILAAVTLLSHQAHNLTLQKQMEATDQWGFFQAKKARQYLFQNQSDIVSVQPKEHGKEGEAEKLRERLQAESNRYKEECQEIEKQAKEATAESHLAHSRGGRYDLAELAVELGLVLCSIAVLTKRRAFWFSGMAAAAIGMILALSALTVSAHAEESHGREPAHRESAAPPEHAPPGP